MRALISTQGQAGRLNQTEREAGPELCLCRSDPQWVAALIRNQTVKINGDGETTGDFCFVDNVDRINSDAVLSESFALQNEVGPNERSRH